MVNGHEVKETLMKRVAFVIAGLSLAFGGCASVNPVKVAQAAPITHKAGQGGYEYASVTRSVPTPAIPEFRSPAPRQTPRIAELPQVTEPTVQAPFDADSVDTELYAHMGVGRTYKVFGKRYTPEHQPDYDKTGTASWYGPKFHGKPTASGEKFDQYGLTAAHKTLPLNSLVHVTNLENGRSMILRVNDRGPFVGDRIIDLSKGAADKLGLLQSGLKEVRVRYAGPADPNEAEAVTRRPNAAPAPRQTVEAPEAVAPTPVEPAPQAQVSAPVEPQSPGFSLDDYQPLRRLPGTTAALPTVPAPAPMPQTAPQTSVPYQAPEFAPQPEVRPDVDDGPLTLTIKGPIHMASSARRLNPDYIYPASYVVTTD
jgi:rare lipoprotein A